jgi:hypothetical protein
MVKDDDLRIELRTVCLLFDRARAKGETLLPLTTLDTENYEAICKLALAHLDAEFWARNV